MATSVQYPTLLPSYQEQQQQQYYTEYTPLVSDRFYYVYRHNDSFLARLRRALVFILLTCLLSLVFFALLSLLLQLVVISETPYTYYLFTKRWPAAECEDSSKCIRNVTQYNRWLIHGLWPEFSNNTWDEYCTKNTFNISTVESIRPELLKSWPNLLKDQQDDSLWAHEWNKHGTCSKLDEFSYFAKTLTLHSKYNLDQWLSDASITPSNSKQYAPSELLHAIGHHIPRSSVALNCEHHRGKFLLKEVYICVSFDDAQTLVPCTVDSTCREHFYYPALE